MSDMLAEHVIMEHQTIRWVRAADEGGVDPGYVPAQSRGRGLNVEVITCQDIYAKKIIRSYQTWNGNGEKTQNFVQIDYNDFYETSKASNLILVCNLWGNIVIKIYHH